MSKPPDKTTNDENEFLAARLTRRRFLQSLGVGAAAAGLACTVPPTGLGPDAGRDAAQRDGGGGLDATAQCFETADNIEGPFYRANAPFRTDLTEPGTVGTPLVIDGRVLSVACAPIAGALIDIWQANDDGSYDNDGTQPNLPPGTYLLRGRQNADADGNYGFRSILPGRYLNGNQFRPAHIHVKVSAPGYVPLTTQLYFVGDPFNGVDPWYVDSLAVDLADAGGDQVGRFDFVLLPS